MSSTTSTNPIKENSVDSFDDDYIMSLFKSRSTGSQDLKDKVAKSSFYESLAGILSDEDLGQYDRKDIFFANPIESGILYDESDEDMTDIKKVMDEDEEFPITSINLLKFSQENNPSLQLETVNRSAFQDQFKPLFNNQYLSDIAFKAKDETTGEWRIIHAHKLIIKARSEYFRTMLRSGMYEATNDVVEIKSIPYDILYCLLEYLYTGVLKITFEKSLLLLSAANQLQMQDVKQIISQYFAEIIDPSIACLLFEESYYQNAMEVRELCLEYIEKNPDRVINSASFQSMTTEMVTDIIKSDSLVIDEFQLFRACVAWAKTQAKLHGLDPEKDYQRFFSKIVEHIRFPMMKPIELRDQIEKYYSDIVPAKYLLEAYKYHSAPKSVKGPRAEPRRGRHTLKFSQLLKSVSIVLSNNDLTAKISSPGSRTVCTDVEWTSGVNYFEVHINNTDSPSNIMVGVVDKSTVDYENFLSHNHRGWAIYAHGGEKYHHSASGSYAGPISSKTTVGVEVDLTRGEIRFFINGVDKGVAYTNVTGPVCPAVTLYSLRDEVTLSPFSRPPNY